MSVHAKKPEANKRGNALRIMPSVRLSAERISATEGVSLSEFINVAVAEKVARIEGLRWAANRRPLTEKDRQEALSILNRVGDGEPEPGDEIPEEYLAWRKRKEFEAGIVLDEVRKKA